MARVVRQLRSTVVLGAAVAVAACSSTPAPSSVASSSITGVASAEPTVAATASVAPVVGPGELWIAFQQFLGKSTVMLARPDGSGLHSPTVDVPGGDQTNPDWSPDGSQLVFAVAIDGRDDLWVVNADGTDARLLADCEGDCMFLDDPAWSPDGRTVLFSRARGVDGEAVSTLEQVDVGSGAATVIAQAAPGHAYAGQRWSPDGTSVVLEVFKLTDTSVSLEVEDVSLAVIDVASPTPAGRELMGAGRFPETAAWAPDGSVIVFGALEAAGGSGTDLFAIAPDGSGLRRLTTLVAQGGSATHPDVTADSKSVVFAVTFPGDDESVLGQVDIDGGEVTPATGRFVRGVHPRSRPLP